MIGQPKGRLLVVESNEVNKFEFVLVSVHKSLCLNVNYH